MEYELYIKVCTEEDVAIKKWGHNDRAPNDLVCALAEEAGEVAHAVNHDEGAVSLSKD